MKKNTLENEIEEISKRIELRNSKIETEIDELSSQIKTYTNFAWIFVWIGFSVTIFVF